MRLRYRGRKMKELKEIELKVGDVVYFENGGRSKTYINHKVKDEFKEWAIPHIVRIERPHYETIYEAPKPILDKEEKKYLSAVIEPFRNQVVVIEKSHSMMGNTEYLYIKLKGQGFTLPYFLEGTMYKGMKLNCGYSLEELGL